MSETAPSSSGPEQRARWKWFLALGLVLLVLGIAGIGVATLMQVTSLLVFGPLLLVSSLVQFLTAIFTGQRAERHLHLAAAGLEAILGFFLMANPPQTIAGLIGVTAVFLVVIGMARLARSLKLRSRGSASALVAGVIAVLLGVTVWIGGSAGKLGFVGLCLAIDFLCHGFSWSALALMERKPSNAPVSSWKA